MSGFNPNISSGTCYYNSSGIEALSVYIPCGNSDGGHLPCCNNGDTCLSSSACYDQDFGVTYVAGCTDSEYESEVCPYKGQNADQQWVGLVYCNGTSNQWSGCDQADNYPYVTNPDYCWCPETDPDVLFEDAATLANIVSLPKSTGQSVSWFGGQGPYAATRASQAPSSTLVLTSSTDTTSQSTSDIPDSGSDVTSAIAIPSSTPPELPSPLGVGQKVGLGVGAGVGGLSVLLLLVFLIRKFWQRKQQKGQEEGDPGTDYPPARQDATEQTWSETKSELPGTEQATPGPTYADFKSPKSEVEGSPARGSGGRPISNGGYEMPGKKGTVFEMPG